MPSFEYSEFDGSQEFQSLSADMLFDQVAEFLLEHGDAALRHLEDLDRDDADLLKLLIKEGYLEKDEQGGLSVTPRGVRRVENKALDELFTIMHKDALGKHATDFKGAGQVRHEDSKPYEYGDPVANLNLHETLKNAMIRGEPAGFGVPHPAAWRVTQWSRSTRTISSFTKRNIRPPAPLCCCST